MQKELIRIIEIIPQNGTEFVSPTGDDEGSPEINYINAIDGIGQESLNYCYHADNYETPSTENVWMRTFLDIELYSRKTKPVFF